METAAEIDLDTLEANGTFHSLQSTVLPVIIILLC